MAALSTRRCEEEEVRGRDVAAAAAAAYSFVQGKKCLRISQTLLVRGVAETVRKTEWLQSSSGQPELLWIRCCCLRTLQAGPEQRRAMLRLLAGS